MSQGLEVEKKKKKKAHVWTRQKKILLNPHAKVINGVEHCETEVENFGFNVDTK